MGGVRQWKMPWQSFYLASVHQARPSEDHSRISEQPWWLLLSSRPRLQLGDEQWLKCPVARMGADLGADLAAHDKVRSASNQSRTQNMRPCTAHHTFTLLLGISCKPRHQSPQRAPASALHCLLDRWLASLDLYMAVCCDRLVLLTPPPLHAWNRAWNSASGSSITRTLRRARQTRSHLASEEHAKAGNPLQNGAFWARCQAQAPSPMSAPDTAPADQRPRRAC